ncbi:MAG TPA: YvcK family protein [Candidatus Paceibacterota bacterium]|nr:YvcK family protein [Candidatus Paceibacterota bacterium]HMO82774.1 YvcK family protein [Candidatus Paceibacterota bacterium]
MVKKKVVVVGGGTGTHTVLRGLRRFANTLDIAAVVSMADSGGSTGRLRDEFGLLPIGDVRNALTALAAEGDKYDSLMRQLFLYRFDKGQGLQGHNFGNLLLTALTDILGDEVQAIDAASHLLKVSGRVLPVTTNNSQLVALYEDGSVIEGESQIEDSTAHLSQARIKALSLNPKSYISGPAAQAIMEADMIVLGPGDLYTSVLANCIVTGFTEALKSSQATVVYVCNLMTCRGQTIGMHASEHIEEIRKYIGRWPDVALVNNSIFDSELLGRYQEEGAHPVLNNCVGDTCTIAALPLVGQEEIILSSGDVVKRSLIRHDSDFLARTLVSLMPN